MTVETRGVLRMMVGRSGQSPALGQYEQGFGNADQAMDAGIIDTVSSRTSMMRSSGVGGDIASTSTGGAVGVCGNGCCRLCKIMQVGCAQRAQTLLGVRPFPWWKAKFVWLVGQEGVDCRGTGPGGRIE